MPRGGDTHGFSKNMGAHWLSVSQSPLPVRAEAQALLGFWILLSFYLRPSSASASQNPGSFPDAGMRRWMEYFSPSRTPGLIAMLLLSPLCYGINFHFFSYVAATYFQQSLSLSLRYLFTQEAKRERVLIFWFTPQIPGLDRAQSRI